MAIKIKKKDGRDDDEAAIDDVESAIEAGAAGVATTKLSEDADPFLRASWETASWIEEHRLAVVGLVVLVFLAVLGGYIGLGFLENQKVEASKALTPAFDSYNTLIEGSEALEQIAANPDLEAPDKTYKSDNERWQAVYDQASAALVQHPNADIALGAKLTKAASASKLEKYDEAIKLYNEYIESTTEPAMKTLALHGLATTYAAAAKWDEALKALDDLAASEPAFEPATRYQKARILERAARVEDAKKLYHEILDTEPNHPSKSDIERRLANM